MNVRHLLPLVLLVLLSAPVRAEELPLPPLIFDVRVGDSFEDVASQQGWYDCGNAKRESLCFDGATTLGQTGRFTIEFLNGKAFVGELQANGSNVFLSMVGQLADWRNGQNTVVSIRTANTEIDIVKAVHDLGSEEAKVRFSRYLSGDSKHLLQNVTFVPRPPPIENAYATADLYLDRLPIGGVVLSLSEYRGLSVTVLTVLPTLADRKRAFPEYCDADCSSWSVPSNTEATDLWGWIAGLFR